jgi:hypothetical protein
MRIAQSPLKTLRLAPLWLVWVANAATALQSAISRPVGVFNLDKLAAGGTVPP